MESLKEIFDEIIVKQEDASSDDEKENEAPSNKAFVRIGGAIGTFEGFRTLHLQDEETDEESESESDSEEESPLVFRHNGFRGNRLEDYRVLQGRSGRVTYGWVDQYGGAYGMDGKLHHQVHTEHTGSLYDLRRHAVITCKACEVIERWDFMGRPVNAESMVLLFVSRTTKGWELKAVTKALESIFPAYWENTQKSKFDGELLILQACHYSSFNEFKERTSSLSPFFCIQGVHRPLFISDRFFLRERE